ncbi:hypothetical protein KAU51_02415 [Candidatus Parcubacteria bacterium]|nr:hypothetical protein [Candidatus Parcubacteria bacterium]
MDTKKINIIGYGYVGQATGIGLKRLGYNVIAYDIQQKENIYQEKDFDKIPLVVGKKSPDSGINIVCIADKVLDDGRQEIGHIAEVLNRLKGKGIIILRTTMLPRLVAGLKFDFYWVEFLHEKKAVEEFSNPEMVVVGRYTEDKFPFEKHFNPLCYCTPEEASHIKYLSNIYNAMRIAFVNEFGDNLEKEGIKKENVIDFFFKKQKYLKWGNAFAGHCLPKDVQAYLKEYPHFLFLTITNKTNEIHRKKYPNLDSIY